MEDDRVAILETQLAQAKQIAEEADRKYEEVNEHYGELSFFLALFFSPFLVASTGIFLTF